MSPNSKNVDGCATGNEYEDGYDHVFFQFLKHPTNYEYSRTVLPNIVYTSFIVNFSEDMYDKVAVLKQNPKTYLVHSKAPFFSKDEYFIRSLYFDIMHGFPSKNELNSLVFSLSNSTKEKFTDELTEKLCTNQQLHTINTNPREACRLL